MRLYTVKIFRIKYGIVKILFNVIRQFDKLVREFKVFSFSKSPKMSIVEETVKYKDWNTYAHLSLAMTLLFLG